MATRPSDLPEFATVLTSPDTTGEDSRQEPTTALKQSGLNAGGYFPRNVFNWLMYLIYTWIEWFDQEQKNNQVFTGNGVGTNLVQIEDCTYMFYAFDKTNSANYCFGIAQRIGSAAATAQTFNNNTITVGTPTGDNLPFSGVTANNIHAVTFGTPH